MKHEDAKTRNKPQPEGKLRPQGQVLGLLVVVVIGLFSGQTEAVAGEALALRRQYNVVSARIDSLVRAMQERDEGSVEAEKLPDGRETLSLPDDTQVVAIFWADDEAKVWVNDHFVGETRLTPVEVVIPNLYLKSDNVIRAKGWDTDFVESGFLFGLYLRRNGKLHPVVVSDDSWQGVEGPVETITYAHAMPDIPQAEVIWSQHTFGIVEMSTRFGAGQVREANQAAGAQAFTGGQKSEMSLHAFVAELAVLETERERLKSELRRHASVLSVPAFTGRPDRGALTLGKAGPLKERVTKPVSERVKSWSEQLPAEEQGLIYPERRQLRGVGDASQRGELVAPGGGDEDRDRGYVPPSDRRNEAPGSQDGQPGAAGGGGGDGEGGEGAGLSGGGFGGRASRLGLLIPTMILATYAIYATRQWRRLSAETS
jgi:hypothetical protein